MTTLRVLALLVVAACRETVSSDYASYADAVADSAIGRGVIPSFVPASATEIKAMRNTDTNQRWLRFRVPAGDTAFLAPATRVPRWEAAGPQPPRVFGDWIYEMNEPPGMTPRDGPRYFRFVDSTSRASCGAVDVQSWFVYVRSCSSPAHAPAAQAAPDVNASTAAEQSVPIRTYGKVLPVDEASRDSSLLAFRTQLLAIVERRDARALFNVVAQDVAVHFGDDRGHTELRRTWRPDSTDSPVWEFLETLLRDGGHFRKPDLFIAPYKAGALPDSLDPEGFTFAMDSNVTVRADSSATATVLGTLRYDIVRLASNEWRPDDRWLPVDIGGGRTGFTLAAAMGGAMGPNIGIERRGGRWLIAFILEGAD